MATSNNIRPSSVMLKDLAKSARSKKGKNTYNTVTAVSTLNNVEPLIIARNVYTANNDLSGTDTGDGVANVVGDLVVVNGQSDSKQNGLYSVQSGAWQRYGILKSGMLISIREGDTYNNSIFTLSNNTDPVIGTDNISFNQRYQRYYARIDYIGTNLANTSGTVEKTGENTFGVYEVTDTAKTLLDDDTILEMRNTLGLSGNLSLIQPLRAVQGLKFDAAIGANSSYLFFLGNDDNFYRIATNGTLTDLGDIGDTNANNVMLVNSNNIVFGNTGGTTVRRYSANGGATWNTATNSTSAATIAGDINISTGVAILLYSGSNTNMSRSTDNGITWTDTSVGSSSNYTKIANNNAASGAIWVISNPTASVARISTDDCATWASVTLPASIITTLNYVNGYFIIIDSTNGKLYYSTTGGTGTWSSMNFIASTCDNIIYFNSKYYARIGSQIFSFTLNDETSFRYENVVLIGNYPLIVFNSKIYTFSSDSLIFELA